MTQTPTQPGMHGPNEVTIVGYDPNTHGFYPLLVSSIQTDPSGQGETYGVLQVAGISASSSTATNVSINDHTNISQFLTVDVNGRIGINNFPVTQAVSGTVGVSSLPPLPTGANVIGHVIVDSAGAVAITSLPALPTGANVIGHVIVDSAGSVAITSLPALPAGTNNIGSVNVANFPATQPISGTVSIGTMAALVAGSAVIGHVLVDSCNINSMAALVAGTAHIGSVNIDNFPATQPVSGTFWQATQPVSIATMPSTPVTGTFWQATQPVSLATAPTTPVTGTFWQATQPISGHVQTDGAVNGAIIPSNALGAAITANTDYTITFPQQVNHFILENNSTNVIQWELDAATSAGSLHLSNANPGNAWRDDIKCTTIHVLSAAATSYGANAGINARGWL